MLSKARLKYIKSLQVKKYRKQEQCFLVEGAKSVLELLDSDFKITTLAATSDFLEGKQISPDIEVLTVSEKELEGLGEFQTNNSAIAVAKMRANAPIQITSNEYALVLDDIRDPGNLGTILRTADWYGITKVIASQETADVYNSKVITSTMGSFTRIQIFYTDINDYLSKVTVPVYGAYLNGKNVHQLNWTTGGLIVIGNESRGIHPDLRKHITHPVTIPRFGQAESLNAGIATAVILDNLRRA